MQEVDIDVILMDINDQLRLHSDMKHLLLKKWERNLPMEIDLVSLDKSLARLVEEDREECEKTLSLNPNDEFAGGWKYLEELESVISGLRELKSNFEAKMRKRGIEPFPDRLFSLL